MSRAGQVMGTGSTGFWSCRPSRRLKSEEAGFAVYIIAEHIICADRGDSAGDIAPTPRRQVGAGLQGVIGGRRWPGDDGGIRVYQLYGQEDGQVGRGGDVCNHHTENRGAINALAQGSRGKCYVRKSSALRTVVQQGKRIADGWYKSIKPADIGCAVEGHTAHDIDLPETAQAAHAK